MGNGKTITPPQAVTFPTVDWLKLLGAMLFCFSSILVLVVTLAVKFESRMTRAETNQTNIIKVLDKLADDHHKVGAD